MKKQIYVGFSGKMGVGKTTICNHIIDKMNTGKKKRAALFSFGDVLKTTVASVFNFPLIWCYNDKNKVVNFLNNHVRLPMTIHQSAITPFTKAISIAPQKSSLTVRELLQWWGTDVVRNTIDKDFWVKKWKETVPSIDSAEVILVDDVRFYNELEAVNNDNGMMYRIEPYPNWDKHSDHESETTLDEYPFLMTNIKYPLYGEEHLKKVTEEIVKDLEGLC
jgi:hypothetical protein